VAPVTKLVQNLAKKPPEKTPEKKVVLVYRDRLLPYSETFILAQGESCTDHNCVYVGLTAVDEATCRDRKLSGDVSSSLSSGLSGGFGQAWQAALRDRSVVLAPLAWPAQLWRLAYRVWGWVVPAWVRSLQAHGPRLIHAHFGPDGGFAASLATSLQIPLIVTFHGYDATCQEMTYEAKAPPSLVTLLWQRGAFFKALAWQRRRVSFQAASRVIAVSQFIRQSLIEMGCPPEKIVVHYTGIDLKLFQPDPAVERERIVLFVGRLVEKKGCRLLIEAISQLQNQLQKQFQRQRGALEKTQALKLVIIGEGGLRTQLESQAQALQSTTAAFDYEFLGVRSPAEVRAWMNRAWLLCAPSLTAASGDAEGLGMVTLEAQAMGLPVVATRSGGIPEAVRDGQTGLLVPEQDVPALAQSMWRLLEDAALRDRLAASGRSHVEKHFNLDKNTAQLEALYDEVITHHHLGMQGFDAPEPLPLLSI